jgi:diguanylate cyclase (GGDEF)-like protein/PAS domain S-box-containing protein
VAIPARASTSWIGTRRPGSSGLTVAVTAGGAVTLLAGLSGAVSPLVAVAIAAVPGAALSAGRLIRLALALHARSASFGPCRGAGLLGLAMLAAGVTAAAPAVAAAPDRPALAGAGLALTVALSLLGLMLLPGAASTVPDRLRRGLDGLSIGVTLSFTFWLLVRPGTVPPMALAEGLVTAGGLAVVTVIAVRAAGYRTAALLCGAGVAAVILGLAALAVPLAHGYAGAGLLPAGAGLLAGPVLAWSGARRAGGGPAPTPPGASALAGYPLLTLPIGAALATALYHLATQGQFDRTAMALGLASAALLAVREALSAADIRRYARRLAGREAHFRSLVAGANDLILVLDDDLTVRWQSPAAARLFGLSDQDVLGRPVLDLLHPEDVDGAAMLLDLVVRRYRQGGRPALVSARLRDGFGRWRDTESTVSDQRDVPEVGALVLHLRDVGERRQLEQQLYRMSCTDQLTALPNRRELVRAVEQRRSVPGHGGALLAVDLQGLGAVNDERGREVGDAVLVEVARRLRAALGPDDVPARLGGDEFGVVTPAGPVQAYALGTRLLAELTRPYQLPGAVVILHASIGLAEVRGRDSVEEVLQRADLACRRGQQLGRDRLEWYDACLEEQLMRRMDMERELAGAVGRSELDLVYQPVVHLLDRRPAGVEALLRWRHPTLGTVLPAELMPVADDLGVSAEIGQWVLMAACRHLSSWLDAGNDLWLSVNMSPCQLTAPDLVRSVSAALAEHRLPAERLLVEVSEARLGRELPAVVTQLAALRALGVRTALDDFGAGQDSLAQLRRLPIDVLKIDGALISEPGRRQGPTRPLVDVVVSLGRRLGMDLIAEGLESRSRLDEALNAGCRLGQGFLLGRPMPAEHLEAYLEDHRTPSL